MSQSFDHYYETACEYTIAIKLNVPIFLEPHVLVRPAPCVKQKFPVYLEPDIYLQPEVQAAPPVCIPQNGYRREELPSHQIMENS
ncbi:MAG TPA: hypothetical protein V6D10_16310 [Trichocoleus sp.]|jgi:hypothetical protein